MLFGLPRKPCMARAADDGRAHVLDRFLQLDGGLPRFPLLIKLIPQPPIDRKAKPGMLAYIYIGADSPCNHQNQQIDFHTHIHSERSS